MDKTSKIIDITTLSTMMIYGGCIMSLTVWETVLKRIFKWLILYVFNNSFTMIQIQIIIYYLIVIFNYKCRATIKVSLT